MPETPDKVACHNVRIEGGTRFEQQEYNVKKLEDDV